MPRRKTEKVKNREQMLDMFSQLDTVAQRFALRYVDDLLSLQNLEKATEKIRTLKATGEECCSFCGKTSKEANHLIAAPDGAYICDECVKMCTQVLEDNK